MTRWTRRGGAAALLVAGLFLAGCTSDEPDGLTLPSPSETPTSPSPTPTPSPEPSPTDPFAVPDEIDAAYVERVLNEIQRLSAGVTRSILNGPAEPQAEALPPELEEQLAAIYGEPLLGFSRSGRLALLRSTEEREDLLPPSEFGQQVVDVEGVLAEDPCIVARITRDFSGVDAQPDPSASTLAFVFLSRSPGANPTGWRFVGLLEGDIEAGSEGEDELRQLAIDDVAAQAPGACR